MLENILFTIRVVFQHVLLALYLLFAGITARKLGIFSNWLILSKMQNLNTSVGFYSIAAGQQV